MFTRARLAVFVDGCFWHGCADDGTLPKNNREWWREKLAGTAERDRRKDDLLRQSGWLPLHLWEHEPVAEAADQIEDLWRQRRATGVSGS